MDLAERYEPTAGRTNINLNLQKSRLVRHTNYLSAIVRLCCIQDTKNLSTVLSAMPIAQRKIQA